MLCCVLVVLQRSELRREVNDGVSCTALASHGVTLTVRMARIAKIAKIADVYWRLGIGSVEHNNIVIGSATW